MPVEPSTSVMRARAFRSNSRDDLLERGAQVGCGEHRQGYRRRRLRGGGRHGTRERSHYRGAQHPDQIHRRFNMIPSDF